MNFVESQISKSLFFKQICHLLGDEINSTEAVSYFLPEHNDAESDKTTPDDIGNLGRARAYCYAMRIYYGVTHSKWLTVSATIDRYNLPITISSVKKLYRQSLSQASQIISEPEPTLS